MVHLFLLIAVQSACALPRNPTRETPESRRVLAAACRQRIATTPGDLEAYRALGYALLDAPGEALPVYEAGLRVAPDNWELQYNAGLTLRLLKRFEDALSALKRAARLDTSRAAVSFIQAALVAQEMKRHDEALGLFRLALRHAPKDGFAWGYMARSFHALGKHAEAVRAWDRAERMEPHGFIDEAGDRAIYERSRVLASTPPQ